MDVALECTGIPPAQRFALVAGRRRGSLTFAGEGDDLTVDVSDDFLRTGITVVGQWHYNRGLAADLVSVIEANYKKIYTFVTHQIPLSEVERAFRLQADGRNGKVVLRPREG